MDYPTEELCARWAAAGAWEPFARAHHANGFAELFRRANGRCMCTGIRKSFACCLQMLRLLPATRESTCLPKQTDRGENAAALTRLATFLCAVKCLLHCLLAGLTSITVCACRWPDVATVAKASFGWRLRLLPYIYTAFHDGHESGCPVMRPLFMAFPGDASVRSNNRQWCVAPPGRRHTTLCCSCRLYNFVVEALLRAIRQL